jgi:hypothetical protein
MIGIGIGTSAPHNRCTGRPSHKTLFHYSSRYFSRNTDGQASSTIIARCVLETEAKKVARP